MTKKSILSFLIIISISFLCLCSCGFEDEYSGDPVLSRPSLNSAEEEEKSSSEIKDPLSEIEGFDYKGKTFTIVTTNREYFNPEKSDSLVEKSVVDRNGMVGVKFNVNIEIKFEKAERLVENAVAAISKGEHYADLIVAPSNVLSELMEEKCLLNLNTLPFLSRSAEYMDESLITSAEINGKLYMLFGALTQTEYSSWCVFYNSVASSKAGIDPFELYKKGEWTWEKFLEFSEKSSELYESGFVTTATETDFVNVLWATTGNRFFGECSSTTLSVPKLENGKAVLSSIKKIIKSKSYGKESGTDALKTFIGGKSSMLLCRRNAVYEICESDMEWKAVPMPKYNSESEHYSYIDGEALAVSVPSNTTDSDFVGRILNALFAATELTVNESINLNELYYYWNSNETALMMEETKKYGFLDIGLTYASAVKDVATVTTENIASSLEAGIAPFQFYHSTKRQFELFAKEYFG